MTDQNTFMETVQNVTEIVRTSEIPMTEEEILAYFADMDLDENQKHLVMDYILTVEQREQEELDKVEEQDNGQENQEASDEEETKSKVFQMYLEELSMIPTITASERNELYDKLVQGDAAMVEPISKAWLKKVLTIAEKYMDSKLNIEDLVQEGNMALFVKLQELMGCGRKDSIEDVLKAAVEEGIMSYAAMISGNHELENTLVGKISLVHEAKKILSMEKGQEPTIEELAVYTKMSIEELNDLQKVMKES